MTSAEVSQLKRSYDRNLGWCRFWLGISLAIATLTFTFAVNQVFGPPMENTRAANAERSDVEDSNEVDPIRFTSVAVMFMLVVVATICAVLSARFRLLYRRNDAALTAIRKDN